MSDLKPPPSYSELKRSHRPLKSVNELHRKNLKEHERFALWITHEVGTMGFFTLIFIWTVFWLLWNVAAPAYLRFDPYPAFVLWLFISNMIQLFLTPLIMVGQNLDSRRAETRAEADFQVNMQAEQEIELILRHLEYQNDLMLRILKESQAVKQELK